MEEFLKQDWRKVEYIGFAGCKIDDIKWRLFADHADLFPNLKWLSLRKKTTKNRNQAHHKREGRRFRKIQSSSKSVIQLRTYLIYLNQNGLTP